MLDVYYGTEKPLPADSAKVCRLVRARTLQERKAVDVVLSEFFTLESDGWHNKRADQEIAKVAQEAAGNKDRQESERERQRRHREVRKNLYAGLREHGVTAPWNATTDELRTMLERVTSPSSHAPVTRDVTAIPLPNNQEPRTNSQEPITKEKRKNGAAAPPSDPEREEIWQTGKAILQGQGESREVAGSFLGKLVKDYGQKLVLQAIRDCSAVTPASAKEWLVARCQERRSMSNKQTALEARNAAAAAEWLARDAA
jgi:uncharacterized protein YdaU (DUF1376 family)